MIRRRVVTTKKKPSRRPSLDPRTSPLPRMSKKNESPYIIGIASDMHVAIIHQPTLYAFEEWCKDIRPDELFLNGDTFDFSVLSTYPKGEDTLSCAVEEVKAAVKIINRLHKYTKKIRIQWGNHCKRWEKAVVGANAGAFKGAVGLTLKEQCKFQGLDERVEWSKETAKTPGVWLGQDLIARHGDLQSGRFGGAVNICTNKLAKNNGVSEIVGHHHRAQVAYRTALGRTSFVMALPTMACFEDYSPGADWQQGWATLSFNRQPKDREDRDQPLVVQPNLALVQNGVAMWGNKVYGKYLP